MKYGSDATEDANRAEKYSNFRKYLKKAKKDKTKKCNCFFHFASVLKP